MFLALCCAIFGGASYDFKRVSLDRAVEEVFAQVARETRQGRAAFILAADFNKQPEQVAQAPWLSRLNASVLHTGQ